ncbi:alpha/beta hydrolase [Nitratireductor mangrovi]|uniref:Alpha/beta hydrolase n=1 Tax=Nitratireductor mangrovi TaxID=2599600 RepID=A0A5B8L090_9HYPH|nr:alpha/beta hydrolase [Nitratireductor mangrovi]QDZ01447.1 alpha/beta hydrolase [Nitratireductor mangrovi]
MTDAPTFLLVHGSWHGPWCWDDLRAALSRRGLASAAVALPSCGHDPAALGGLAEDAAAVGAAAAAIAGDVVVVGHSYGGAAISEAEYGPNVKRLVYVAAFMPDAGRSSVSYLPPGPMAPYIGLRDDGTMEVPAGQAVPSFYHDCTPEVAAAAEAQLCLQSQAVLGPDSTRAAWRSLPSTYIVTTDDRALPADFQRMFAAQASETRDFASSHSPFLSRPDDFADLLAEVAGGR